MQEGVKTASHSIPERELTPDQHGPQGETESPRPEHQSFVFTDLVALRYLEEDPSTVVLHRRLMLRGFEIYIVEQWACSRDHPTFVITTYTGDNSHTVFAGVLSVPTDEAMWSSRLKLYFSAVAEYHAGKKETTLGNVMVTDLGNFPNDLTVIPVPGGDLNKHRKDFVVNENLKRLGCSGRAGLKLQRPSAATEAKFHQLYRTSERISVYTAVVELVKQCQIALVMFDKLAPEYVDGLLCDMTMHAISDWWTDIGTELYDIEPTDGIMGPTTVSALLGTFIGARNRLHAFGAPVGKDAFDIPNLKLGIGNFQNSFRLPRTRRLDLPTLEKLRRVTAKAAISEGWTGAVRSTVAELGGKGGEMVRGMVGGRDKAGIVDIETPDIDDFAHLVSGERAKWLWQGKPRKSPMGDDFADVTGPGEIVFAKDDHGRYVWTSRRRQSTEDLILHRPVTRHERSPRQYETTFATDEKDQRLSKTVRRGVSSKVSDARAGFGRFKDAVGLPGLRSHLPKHARQYSELTTDSIKSPVTEESDSLNSIKINNFAEQDRRDSLSHGEVTFQQPTDDERAHSAERPLKAPRRGPQPSGIVTELAPPRREGQLLDETSGLGSSLDPRRLEDDVLWLRHRKRRSIALSKQRDRLFELASLTLCRPQSCGELNVACDSIGKDNYWPRHLSFSAVEDVVLKSGDFGTIRPAPEDLDASLDEAVLQEDVLASEIRMLSCRIKALDQDTAPWVTKQVDAVDGLNQALHDRHETLNGICMAQLDDYRKIRDRSSELLTEEITQLNDSTKRVELLGAKLDYELNVLESKVEDVEAGLEEFEQHIIAIEARTKTLFDEEEHKSSWWGSWVWGLLGFAPF